MAIESFKYKLINFHCLYNNLRYFKYRYALKMDLHERLSKSAPASSTRSMKPSRMFDKDRSKTGRLATGLLYTNRKNASATARLEPESEYYNVFSVYKSYF